MRVNEKMKKLLSSLLCLCMLAQNLPVMVFATTADNLCDHHTEHTVECGYVEAVAGSDCTHVHDVACGYVEAVAEVLCTCTETDDSGAVLHTEGCGYVAPVEGSDCTHTHDDACGYAAAAPAHECHYECAECALVGDGSPVPEAAAEDSGTGNPSPTECTCGTDDALIHATTCAVYVAPETAVCYCTEKCSDTNEWCDVCGVDFTACTGTDTSVPYAEDCTCTTKCAEGSVNGECAVCSAEGADLSACIGTAAVMEGPIDATAMTADELQAAVAEKLAAGATDIEIILAEDTDATMFSAITAALAADGVADGSINLTIIGAKTVPDYGFFDSDNYFANGEKNIAGDKLKSLTLTDVETIGEWAFSACTNLDAVNMPKVVTIGEYAFNEWKKGTKLTSLDLPNATTIGESAFAYSSLLTSVNLPKVVTIGVIAFAGCDLRTLDLPEVTTIGGGAFEDNYNLVSCSAPKATTFGYYPWGDCSKLETLELTAAGDFTISNNFSAYTPFEQIDLVLNIDKQSQVTQNADGTATWAYTYIYGGTEGTETKTFKSITFVYFIEVSAIENGTVIADKSTAAEGETVTLTVTPAEGYVLDTLTVIAENATNPTLTETYSFVMPAGNVAVTASFKACTHTGGTATCTTLAVCETCGASYGEVGGHGEMDDTTGLCSNGCGTNLAAAKVGDVYYTDFATAVANWTDNTTLTLLDNVTGLTEQITISGNGLVLDLNGKSMTSTISNTLSVTGGELTIRDSVGTGSFTTTGYTVLLVNEDNAVVNFESGTLQAVRVNRGTFNMTGGKIYSEKFYGIDYSAIGTVHISGGEVTSTKMDAIYNSYGTLTVTGTAKITSTNGYAISNYRDSNSTTISGDVVLSGSKGEFDLGKKIVLNTQPTGGTQWDVKIHTDVNTGITGGVFATPGEGVTLDSANFASAMEGYEVKQNAKGELLLCDHSTVQTAASNGDGTHKVTCGCGQTTIEASVTCSGGEATCTTQAVCTTCGASYGELAKDNHTGALGTYAPTEDGTQHVATYDCCNATATEGHTFDSATGKCACGLTQVNDSNTTITLGEYDPVFDGSEKEPNVTVVVNGKTLTEGTDYDVSYANNCHVGTATVTVTFKGDYTGSVTKNFTIEQDPRTKPFDGAWVGVSNASGSANAPAASGTVITLPMVANPDYTEPEETETEKFEFYGYQMCIGTDLSMKFYVYAECYEFDPSLMRMEFIHNGVVTTSYYEYIYEHIDGVFFVHTFEGINPQCMGDNIEAYFYYEGVQKAVKLGYTVESNLNALLEEHPDDAALVALINDTLAYGEAAEAYTGHTSLEGSYTVRETTIPASSPVVNETISGSIQNATLHLGDSNSVKVTYADGETKTLTSDAIMPCDFAAKMQFSVDGLFTLGYSVNDYLYAVSQDSGASSEMKTLAQALYNYGISAHQYVGNHSGGTQTCKGYECEICGEWYGEPDESKHVGGSYSAEGAVITDTCSGCGIAVMGTATVTAQGKTYDGTAVTATVAGTGTLADTEFTVTYCCEGGCVTAGDHTATITLDEVTASVSFTIEKATPTYTAPTAIENLIYTGEAQTLITAGSATGGTMQYKVDDGAWSAELPKATDAGEYTVSYRVVGDENYNDVAEQSIPVTIGQKNLAGATVTLEETTFTYDGQPHKPAVTVTLDGKELTEGTDYTVTYRIPSGMTNNQPTSWLEQEDTFTNAGIMYYAVVEGMGNYYTENDTTLYANFRIEPKTVTEPTFAGLEESYLHTGEAIEPAFKLMDGDTEIPASEYDVAYSDNTAAGTATITITDKTGGNYTVSGSAAFEIVEHTHDWKYTASGATITATCEGAIGTCPVESGTVTIALNAPEDLAYDGTEKTVTVTQTPAGVFTDLPAVTYVGDCKSVGSHTASLTYGEATATLTFTITCEHSYTAGEYDWNDDYTACTVTGTCTKGCGTTADASAAVKAEQTKAPTCSVMGETTYTATFTESWAATQTQTVADIPATGEHNYATEVEGTRVAATCMATGSVTMKCACGATEVQTLDIDKTNHTKQNTTVKDAVAATCGADGYTGDTYCECGQKIDDGKTILATGEHNYATEVEESRIPATCMATGSVTMKCACGATEVQTLDIDKTNHTKQNTTVKDAVAATCGADGYTGDTYCECGQKIADGETIPATGEHNYATEVEESRIPATCMATGSVTMKCACGATEVQTLDIDKTNHTKQNTTVKDAVAATCGTDGYTGDTYCECGQKIDDGKTIPATGEHNYIPGEYVWSDDYSSCTVTGTCGCGATAEASASIASEQTKAPTCTEKGETTYTATFTESWAATQIKTVENVPAKDHAWSVSYDWSDDGKTCTATHVCGNDASHNEAEAATATGAVKTEATCTEKGWTTYTANFEAEWAADGQTKDVQDIPVVAHTPGAPVEENRAESTCTVAGSYDEVVYCSVCKTHEISREKKTLELADHTPGAPVEENRAESTCTVAGSYDEVVYCSVCKTHEISREKKTLELAEHTPGAPVEENRAESTCTVAGSYDEVVYCSACKAHEISREKKTLELADHTPGTPVEENRAESTCTVAGSYDEVVYCAVCKTHEISREKKTMELAEHTEETVQGYAPTCTEPGLTDGTKCGICGEELTRQEEIPALGHNVVLKESEAPTCELNGYEYYACERCGGQEYTILLEATGHNYEDGICTGCGEEDPNASEPNKPGWGSWFDKWFGSWWGDQEECEHSYTSVVTKPTCTEKGYTTHTCDKCGDCYKDSYTDALGHNYEDGTCTRCGEEDPNKPTEPSEPQKPSEPNKPGWGNIWDWIGCWWK